jgi:hypothetical protein
VISLSDIEALNSELEDAVVNLTSYHSEMNQYLNFYEKSAFYPAKAGEAPNHYDPETNLLATFADKNIDYTCAFPNIKVPTTGADPTARQAASTREKILYAVWRKSNGDILARDFAEDGTLFSMAIAETGFDLKNRCAWIRRHDPRHCYWQYSNDSDNHVIAFWIVYPITKDEAFRRYGVQPTADPLSGVAKTEEMLQHIDGKDWFTFATRIDESTRTVWIGNRLVEEPHQHMKGSIGVHIAIPFRDKKHTDRGKFYVKRLVPLQAELNDTFKRRGRIVRRMSSPVIYGRGLMGRKFDEVEAQLAKSGGGFVPLTQNGELGILQVSDTKMLDEHEQRVIYHMMKRSGFSEASFGESVGANTSGDALGMYFTPSEKHIAKQNIAWKSFYESINADILRLYDKFGKINEQFKLSGYAPSGTLLPMIDDYGIQTMKYQRGTFDITFTREVIAGNYTSVVIPAPTTPKNEIEEQRLAVQSVTQKFMSRTTAYEKFGILSPEDELALLEQEQSSPLLNPDGTNTILNAQNLNNNPQKISPTAPPYNNIPPPAPALNPIAGNVP